MQKLLLILMTLVLSMVSANSQSQLLESGQASKLLPASSSPANLKVVSYNIRWRSGVELQQLAQLLKNDPEIGGAAVIALQEVDRHKARSRKANAARKLAETLGMYYAWAAPSAPVSGDEEETGVVLLSSYPLTEVHRIILPNEGPGKRRRVALGATIRVGPLSVRVYSVHSETRIPIEKKLEQMNAVLADLAHYPKDSRAIVMGDLNTWEQESVEKTFKLFTEAHFHTPFDDQPTFSRRLLFLSIDLKLDWIWLRNLEEIKHGVDREIGMSDHWPLWLMLRLKPT